MPSVTLEVFKDGDHIETITLQGKSFFVLGRNQSKVDLPLLHDSISREHAVILFDEHEGAMLIDLGSTSGTKMNNEPLLANCGQLLKNDFEIVFGASSRLYKVTVDYSKFQKALIDK